MRIAVPYYNGNINPAFGKSEYYKLYDTEDGKILSIELKREAKGCSIAG